MNKKHFLITLLILALTLALAVSVSAVESNVTTVGSFEELKDALSAGGSIKLSGDITTEEALIVSGVTATIDLDGNTLTLGAADNKFKNATNLTIENGTINFDGLVCKGNGIVCLDEYGTDLTTLTLNDVNVEGKDYSSAYGIFYVGKTSAMYVNGGTFTLENEKYSAGGVFKADASSSKLYIDGTVMNFTNPVRFITAMTAEIKNADITVIGNVEGGLDHGFNNCDNLTITDSTVTVSGGAGRGITLGRVNASTITINGNSVVKISDMGEGAVLFHSAKGAVSVLNIADTAVLLLDEKILNDAEGTVNVAETAGLCEDHAITPVEAKDSTCTATGNIAHYTCEACERVYSNAEGETEITAEDTVVKMKDHTYNEGVQTTAPTCDKTGVKTYTCTATDCGHTKTETIAAAGHKLTKIDAKAPTYTAEGNIEHYLCSVCKKLYADAEAKTELTADKITIAMLIKVEEEKAEVSEDAVDSAITEAAKNETSTEIVLDLNKVAEDAVEDTTEKPAEVVSVQLPVASLEKVAELHEEATLTVVMKEATVTMDAATLEAVTKQAEGSTVTLVVEQIPVEELTDKQQAAVENKEVVATISAQIICDATGNTIHDFDGGNVTVQIPFTPEEGTKGEDYAVYYVADDGSVEKIETKYVDGHLVVTLEHFSEYVIVNTKANADPSNPATGALSMAPVMALLVINSIGAGALIAGKKRFF